MAHATAEHLRPVPRAVWLAARARNAVRRPIFIGTVAVGALAAAGAGLVLAPHQVRRVGRVAPLAIPTPPDTIPLLDALARARVRVASADSSLAVARAAAAAAPKVAPDTTGPLRSAQRDSLSNAISSLDELLTRAESAPVSASYHALADAPQLAGSGRMKVLVDSLTEVEHDRDAFGTTGTADPMYLALAARANEIGRAIQDVAQTQRDTLRDELSRLTPTVPQATVTANPAADTAAWTAERDSAQSLQDQAVQALNDARQAAKDKAQQVEQAKEQARLAAPPAAIFGAALVLGIVLGFGWAYGDETRHPTVSDAHEVERVTGLRVLATIAPRPREPDRARRQADRYVPRYFDPLAGEYQLTYLHVARTGASRVVLTLVGEDTRLAAIIAMNVAAIAADEARATLVVDTDARGAPVAAALGIHAEPGLADIIGGRSDWPGATTETAIGRDRTIDVVPAGVAPSLAPSAVTEAIRRDAARLTRHYDALFIVARTDQAAAGLPGALPIADTIICARLGQTRLAAIQAAVEQIRAGGGNAVGVVLWTGPVPALPSAEGIAASQRPLHTAEMRALTPS